ncbi:recombinase family protein [Ethanoligenens harbinense]|uniref:Resolvase domain n=1 Tax=Ethanoligenens harbinense (strain DSM 18485 / JCM 12961 / CGMCC 1.5033 / YUAN-3) TaxID=663278 RepID=E6U622_ETHHY|nr:recombinase family protein [Ethanoligenens harbinense]ADU25701.1 Resolvase domain [Ethanoligenens harbinense YUAN-3]ADU26063.1 Resolvase domain [Ethanoligenens harbinense YUAN-3]AVQ94874.1 recombinase [Ethanoligenens harbinense YUAN-3]AVQ95208.1 recombinase [Ethanoligenens harbinense YUAN-3]AYF37565.1 recombinase [Ethanoligenens harbinense]
MLLGYARVSTGEQLLDRQIDALELAGVEKIYHEKVTGAKVDRPKLNELLNHLRSGDVIVVSDLTRLSRSTKDLFSIVDRIQLAGADIKSLKESWIDTTTPQGKLLFTIFAGISQFERDLISQRTREGIAAAASRGRHGGRPSKRNPKADTALKMYDSQEYTIPEICSATGLSKSTLYRYVASRNQLRD